MVLFYYDCKQKLSLLYDLRVLDRKIVRLFFYDFSVVLTINRCQLFVAPHYSTFARSNAGQYIVVPLNMTPRPCTTVLIICVVDKTTLIVSIAQIYNCVVYWYNTYVKLAPIKFVIVHLSIVYISPAP